MKINREKLLEMWGLFEKLSAQKNAVKFHYVVLKNKRLIQSEVESLREANTPPEEYQEFEQKRITMCRDYADKDENGQVKTNGNNFVISDEKKEEFEAKLAELKEEYKELFDKMETSQKDFMELLKGEVEVDFVEIPMSIMPDTLSGQEVEILFDIVKEDV